MKNPPLNGKTVRLLVASVYPSKRKKRDFELTFLIDLEQVERTTKLGLVIFNKRTPGWGERKLEMGSGNASDGSDDKSKRRAHGSDGNDWLDGWLAKEPGNSRSLKYDSFL